MSGYREALTAVDIVLDPDAAMRALAAEHNGRMLRSVPAPHGFALDANHRPHISLLQRYVRTAAIDQVCEAIAEVHRSVDLAALTLEARALTHVVLQPAIGIGAVLVAPGAEVIDLQARLIDALEPFAGLGGTADAFVRTADEPDIDDATIEFIETYVPQHSGANYVAHVTVGLARLDDLAVLEAQPFRPLAFSAEALSIYQLGNNGTAARLLKTWIR